LKQLEDRLQARRLGLEVTDEAKAHLARAGYDPAFGARPLKRLIQRAIGDPLAVAMLEDRYTSDDTVVVDVDRPGETDPSLVLR
ncbi:MAG: hypothetical protein F4Y12_14145, partial [Acidimicrobiaceae bacterium]|nr:hypothetical protein [Acidimicrobiaceae bacterium]MYK75713.1 hypothetical protein [Acidimicrobiaceae bacterium]